MNAYLLFFTLFFCGLVNAQNWESAHWQTIDGRVDSGAVVVPKRMLTKDWQVRYRSVTGIPQEGEHLDWLVTRGDTLYVRDHYEMGTSTLYQQVVGGQLSLYHAIARKGTFDWQIQSSAERNQVDFYEFLPQMNRLVGEECPELGRKVKEKPTTYNLLLAAEDINHCLGPEALRYSFLGKPIKWRLNFGVITPINLIQESDDLGAYWGVRFAAERSFRRLYNGFYLTAGLQPYYYRQNSKLVLGPLNGSYRQEWKMSALQTNIGIKIEPFPTARVSPYGELGFGVVFPFSHQRYAVLEEGEPQSPGYPISSSLKGGMKVSGGIYLAYGLRAKYNEKWAVCLQISRDGMFVDLDYGDLSGGGRSLFFNQDNALLIGEWRRWELLLQRQF
jgi:hypothetical protein